MSHEQHIADDANTFSTLVPYVNHKIRSEKSSAQQEAEITHYRGLELQEFQRQAISHFKKGHDVVVAAPTGAGKTLVADWAIEHVMQRNRRAIYTSPVKALSNQKYRDYSSLALQSGIEVGLVTGDVVKNNHAHLQVMTTEIFHNRVLENPESLKYTNVVVFDELHYLDDELRGTIWEEAMMFAPSHIQIIALSASLPNIGKILAWMKKRLNRRVSVARCEEEDRPIPLHHHFWVPQRLLEPATVTTDAKIGDTTSDDAQKDDAAKDGVINDVLEAAVEAKNQEKQDEFAAVTSDQIPKKWLAWSPERRRLYIGGKRNGFSETRAASQSLIDFLQENDRFPVLYFCTARKDCEVLAAQHADRDLLSDEERADILERYDHLVDRYMVRHHDTAIRLRELVGNGIAFHHAGMIPSLKLVVEELFTTRLLRLLFATETFAVGVNMPAKTVCFHYLAKNQGGQKVRALLAREYSQMAGRAGRNGKDDVGYVYSILNRLEVTPDDLRRFVNAEVEEIHSRFEPGYRSLLKIVFERNTSLKEAWDLSFAAFTSPERKTEHPRLRAMKGRWRFLERLRYITKVDDSTFNLTPKGQICEAAGRFEIQITEAYDGGLIRSCSPIQIAALFASIACQKNVPLKAGAEAIVLDPELQSSFEEFIKALISIEKQEGINRTMHEPNFRVAPLAKAWASGKTLPEVMNLVGNGGGFREGDLIVTLRMAVQGINKLNAILATDDECRPLLKEAAARIYRDEVDPSKNVLLDV